MNSEKSTLRATNRNVLISYNDHKNNCKLHGSRWHHYFVEYKTEVGLYCFFLISNSNIIISERRNPGTRETPSKKGEKEQGNHES